MALGKFLTVDPGEDTGWSVWNDTDLIDAGTTKMWDFSDAVWTAVLNNSFGIIYILGTSEDALIEQLHGIQRIVVENWALYPWVLKTGAMDFDECRTARLIGSLYSACRVAGLQYEQQPALIKERALAAGAETYFSHPLHENRHANDAIMHGVFRNALEAGANWTDLSQTSWEA